MASTQPTPAITGNPRGNTKLPHAPSKTTSHSSHRSSSAGKVAPIQPRVNSNTRMPSGGQGQGRKTHVVGSRTQMNNNNKTAGASSRPIQSHSAGRVKINGTRPERGVINGSAGHQDRSHQNSAEKSKR